MNTSWKVASVLALLATQPVWGCGGDYECEPYLALQGDGLDCEVQSLPFLSPNNDLGTNLALLYPTTAQPGDASSPEPMDEVELARVVSEAARKGSTQAMKLRWEMICADRDQDQDHT